jgi:hypothetical protein
VNQPIAFALSEAMPETPLKVKSITVEPIKNGASTAEIVLDNSGGRYSPDKAGDFYHALWPSMGIFVAMGYGEHYEWVFAGAIDEIYMKTWPQEITIIARDVLKRALDQTVTDDLGQRSLSYTAWSLLDIVFDLAIRSGWTVDNTYVDASADSIETTVTFTHITYAEAFKQLAELYNYEFHVGREGEFYFQYATDRQPEAVDEAIVLNGTTAEEMLKYPVVTASIRVRSVADGGGDLYSAATDYEITEGDRSTEWTIKRRAGSTIPDGGTVYVSYVYAAWVFREGEDIISLGYSINDADIYRTITVLGKTETDTVCHGNASYASADYYNLPTDKVLIVEDSTSTSSGQCENVAEKMVLAMGRGVREVEFEAVGNPYLWVGDCIMVIESSTTVSEIYQITSLTHSFNAQGKPIFGTRITARYYGYSPAGSGVE